MPMHVHVHREEGWKLRVWCHMLGCTTGPGVPTAAATESMSRDLTPPGFASRTVQTDQVGKKLPQEVYLTEKIFLFFPLRDSPDKSGKTQRG